MITSANKRVVSLTYVPNLLPHVPLKTHGL